MPNGESALATALASLAALGNERDREQIQALLDRLDAARLRVLVWTCACTWWARTTAPLSPRPPPAGWSSPWSAPTHSKNVNFFGVISAGIEAELAKLDASRRRPCVPVIWAAPGFQPGFFLAPRISRPRRRLRQD